MDYKDDPSDTASNDSANPEAVRTGGPSRRCFRLLIAIIVALAVTVAVLAGLLAKANSKGNNESAELSVGVVDTIEQLDDAIVPEGDDEVEVETVVVGGSVIPVMDGAWTLEEVKDLLVANAEAYGFALDPEEFDNEESYHLPAVEWAWNTHDSTTMSAERLAQRFALACLFFATNRTVPLEDGTVVEPWAGTNWLVAEDECTWAGITCSNYLEESTTGGQTSSMVRGSSTSKNTKEPKITKIDLSRKGLTGVLPKELAFLQEWLQTLDLSQNSISHSHADDANEDWLGQMTGLMHLYYGQTLFTSNQGVPASIGMLTNLMELDCSFTRYSGPLEGESFSALSNLEFATLSGNSFGSSVPTELASLPNLKFLYLQNNALTGDLSFMKSMVDTKMVEFWMDNNPGISGEIPSEVGLLTALQSWSITNCSLTGTLPTELSNLPLKQFWCDPNDITGDSVTSLEGIELTC